MGIKFVGVCNSCHDTSELIADTEKELIENLRDEDWVCDSNIYYCPDCVGEENDDEDTEAEFEDEDDD